MTRLLDVTALEYPVLAFSDEMVDVFETATKLTTCPKSQLKELPGMLIVDANGLAYTVERALKVADAGREWVSIFPMRMIRIDLLVREGERILSTDEVRQLINDAAMTWHGLEAGGTEGPVREGIERAQSVRDLIEALNGPIDDDLAD